MHLTILLWTENHRDRETIVCGAFTSEEKLEAAKIELSKNPLMAGRLQHGWFWTQSQIYVDEPFVTAL